MEPTPTPPNDFLAEMGIHVETPIDDTVLTASVAENVRFRSVKIPNSSKTFGYVFNEVDKFIREIVTPSLRWYQKALHQRDLDVYNLAALVDTKIAAIAQLEESYSKLQYNYQLQQGLASNQNDKEMVELVGQLRELQAENEMLRQGSAIVSSPVVGDNADYTALVAERDALNTHITNLEAYIEEIRLAYETLEAQVVASNSTDLPVSDETIENLIPAEQYNQLLAQYETLSAQYTEDVEALQAELTNAKSVVAPVDNGLAELEAHIAALEAHITVLNQRYTDDMLELQTRLDNVQKQSADDPENDLQTKVDGLTADNAALAEHVQAITDQYNALAAQYTEDVEALQAQLVNASSAPQENDGTVAALEEHIKNLEVYAQDIATKYQELQEEYALSTNYAEIGQLKVKLAASEAEVVRLTDLLDEQEEEEKLEQPSGFRLPLLTEKRPTAEIELPPTINLPPGIRPDDL